MNQLENQCPAWDQFVLPILQLATTKEVSRKIAKEEVPKMMALSPEIMDQRLNSGARRVDNRIGWAMSHLTKGEAYLKSRPSHLRNHRGGQGFLREVS